MNILIADSGATKAEWCMLHAGRKKIVETQGISPYFLDKHQIEQILRKDLLPGLKQISPDKIFYYGTGCASAENRKLVHEAIKTIFPRAKINVDHDLMGAARALCGE